MDISFNGAAQLVTGSSYLLSIEDKQIIIDFGMFQGLSEVNNNYNELKFDPLSIDFVILTHAHLDHCGLLPLLIKKGYKGPIFSTVQTKQISEIILLDSAKLQEINARENNMPLLYNTNDVFETLALFEEIDFFQNIVLTDNINFELLPVGHILGAASIFIRTNEGNLLFSGDIGRSDQSIIRSFNEFDFSKYDPQYIIMESLYGGIEHESKDANIKYLLNIITDTYMQNGSIFIPIFSLHRAQEVLNILKNNMSKLSSLNDIHFYLDSPMAHKITNIYENNSNLFNDEFIKTNRLNNTNNNDSFSFDKLNIIKKSKRSQKVSINNRSVILAGSGMADGGRILNHLYNNLSNKFNSIVFVGYQAEGTLGHQLVNNIKEVKIRNKDIHVKAKIDYLRGFSAHADNTDLKNWINKFNISNLRNIFLVHAEKDKILNFSEYLNSLNIKNFAPSMYEVYNL